MPRPALGLGYASGLVVAEYDVGNVHLTVDGEHAVVAGDVRGVDQDVEVDFERAVRVIEHNAGVPGGGYVPRRPVPVASTASAE